MCRVCRLGRISFRRIPERRALSLFQNSPAGSLGGPEVSLREYPVAIMGCVLYRIPPDGKKHQTPFYARIAHDDRGRPERGDIRPIRVIDGLIPKEHLWVTDISMVGEAN